MHAEALVIYGDNTLAREMRYSDFMAVLDGVVTAPDFANQHAEAVYVQLNGRLQISVMVFFRLPFNGRGQVDPDWNMPLQAMAAKATLGPPIAGTKTQLMCRSQCPQKWHSQLWEPKERQGCDPFEDLHLRLVKSNRLRLLPELLDTDVHDEYAQQLQQLERQWAHKVTQLENDLLKANQTIAELQATNGKLRQFTKALKAQYLKLKSSHERIRSV